MRQTRVSAKDPSERHSQEAGELSELGCAPPAFLGRSLSTRAQLPHMLQPLSASRECSARPAPCAAAYLAKLLNHRQASFGVNEPDDLAEEAAR